MSKSDDLGMSQDVTVIYYKAGQTSSKSNIDINAEVMKQSNLSYMYSNKVYSCSHCLMSICGENTYRKHVGNCSKYKCGKCNKTFFSESSFQKHRLNCPPKRYPCKICKKDYSRQSDADEHMKTHALIRETFTCHWCGCQCLTWKQLQLHIEQAHADLL